LLGVLLSDCWLEDVRLEDVLSLSEGLVLRQAVVLFVCLAEYQRIVFRKCNLGRSLGLDIVKAFLLCKELPYVPLELDHSLH